MIAALALACAPSPSVLVADAVPGGIDVRADGPLARVELKTADGRPITRRQLPNPSAEVWLDAAWTPGERYRLDAVGAGGERLTATLTAPDPGTAVVTFEAPLGQDARAAADGATYTVALVEGASVQVGVGLVALEPATGTVSLGDRAFPVDLRVAGDRRTVVDVVDGPLDVRIDVGDTRLSFRLETTRLTEADAAARLVVLDTIFPADVGGGPDLARPPGRVTLPAAWWERVLRAVGLGFRPPDAQAPWGLEAVTLRNDGDDPLNVVLTSRIVDEAGRPAPAFRPRLREADGALREVNALLRVPARGAATALLPVFVDRAQVEEGAYVRELELLPLGAAEPLRTVRTPLYVSRGSGAASAAFVAACAATVAGVLLVVTRLRAWLGAFATSELTTIALFGSLQFVVGVGSQLFAVITLAVLGPFSPLLTGFVDDAFRAALLCTLVTLLPKPGAAAISLLVGYLLRVLAMGSLSPVDVVYLGAAVTFVEGSLWLSGLTRSGAWRDAPPFRRWLRLFLGLAPANVLQAATGIVVHVVMYRLFFADWYVALVLIGPSFLYVALACALAVPFADSLRRVEA